MPNPYFDRQPIENALIVSREIAKILAKRKAVVYPPGKEGAQDIIALIQNHVLPTINMMHGAHDHCVLELGQSSLLQHLRVAYQATLKSDSPPEDDADFVESLVAMSLDAAVRKVIIRTEGDAVSTQDPAHIMSAHTIVDRLAWAMRRSVKVQISYASQPGHRIMQYFATNPDGTVAKNPDGTRRAITYDEYNRRINDPNFEVLRAGPQDETGDRYFVTRGKKILVRRNVGHGDEGEIEEVEDEDVDWDTIDTSLPPTAADREDIRSHLAADAALSQMVPATGDVSITGDATLITPTLIRVSGNDIPLHAIHSGPLPADGRFHILAASQEILDDLVGVVANALLPAFRAENFSAEKTREIVAAASGGDRRPAAPSGSRQK